MAKAPGLPVWFDLTTPDVAASERFYAAVAGWSISPSPVPEHGGYRIVSSAAGVGIGGMMTPPPDAPAASGWSIHFAVDDVDAAAERIRGLGGTIHFGPADIPQVGRFAVAADPQGVVFFVMAGTGADESGAFDQSPGMEGHGAWVELATPDPDGALAFYGALFGWSRAGAMPMGPMGDYTFIGTAGGMGPGAIMSSTLTGAPAGWIWYVHVPDIDTALAAVMAGGGKVLRGPDPIPGGEYSANVIDPLGNAIGLAGPSMERAS